MKRVGVQCRGIGLSYGTTEVLRDVTLEVEAGEFFALLGPSGSGKSTLLRVIAGFARHQRGALLVGGADVSAQPPWQRDIGMVFQSYALWPHLDVHDNVAFGLVERKVARAERDRRVAAALELVGLAGYQRRRPSQLSGGQQQRVALARTIVIEPKVLLLDEPLSNLDRTLRVQMRRELLALQRRLGITTIFVTHDQEEAMTTADRMAVLDRGVVQQVGAPAALYDQPANPFVAGFVGTMNLLPATVHAAPGDALRLEVAGAGVLDAPRAAVAAADRATLDRSGATAQVAFRPHALRLGDDLMGAAAGSALPDDGAAAAPQPLLFDAVVEASEFLGEVTRYRLRVGAHALAADQPHRTGAPLHAAGTRVRLMLDPAQVRVFAGAAG